MVFTGDFIPKGSEHLIEEREKVRRASAKAANVKEYDKRKFVPFRGQVWKEDYVCQSTQGYVGHRREHLATSDRAIILLRKQLLEAMETVQNGGVPKGIVPKAKENEMISLEAYRAVLTKPQVEQLLNGHA
jgi:hypothetical protein